MCVPVSACGHIISLFTHARANSECGSRLRDNDYTDRRVDSNIMVVIVIIVCAGKNRETVLALCVGMAAVERTK